MSRVIFTSDTPFALPAGNLGVLLNFINDVATSAIPREREREGQKLLDISVLLDDLVNDYNEKETEDKIYDINGKMATVAEAIVWSTDSIRDIDAYTEFLNESVLPLLIISNGKYSASLCKKINEVTVKDLASLNSLTLSGGEVSILRRVAGITVFASCLLPLLNDKEVALASALVSAVGCAHVDLPRFTGKKELGRTNGVDDKLLVPFRDRVAEWAISNIERIADPCVRDRAIHLFRGISDSPRGESDVAIVAKIVGSDEYTANPGTKVAYVIYSLKSERVELICPVIKFYTELYKKGDAQDPKTTELVMKAIYVTLAKEDTRVAVSEALAYMAQVNPEVVRTFILITIRNLTESVGTINKSVGRHDAFPVYDLTNKTASDLFGMDLMTTAFENLLSRPEVWPVIPREELAISLRATITAAINTDHGDGRIVHLTAMPGVFRVMTFLAMNDPSVLLEALADGISIDHLVKIGAELPNPMLEEVLNKAKLVKKEKLDYPDEFLDPITCVPLTDPIVLPDTKHIINRPTLGLCSLGGNRNPFSMVPITDSEIEEFNSTDEVKKRVADLMASMARWKASQSKAN